MSQEKKLSTKQIRFCEEYVIDWNAKRAAIAAGYSKKTAKEQGSRLLTNVNLKNYIEEIQKDISKLAGVSALRNAMELKKLAYGNFTDIKSGWSRERDFAALSDDIKACISDIQYVERETLTGTETFVKFKLHDKLKAIESLNKMLGFNSPDKIDHTSKGESLFPKMTEEEKQKEIDALIRKRQATNNSKRG